MESNLLKKPERNYGIDLLRIIAMLLVVVLHVLGQGGVLEASKGVQAAVAWFFEVAAYCAVDVYALISGYVGYRDDDAYPYFRNILRFWIPVFFYSICISSAYMIYKPQYFTFGRVAHALFPISSNQYWFASSFFIIVLFKPFLNRIIRLGDEKSAVRHLVYAAFCLVVYYQLASYFNDPFTYKHGYSAIWLLILYYIGGTMKRCGILNTCKKRYAIIGFLVCTILAWSWKVLLPKGFPRDLLVSYTSIPIVINAVCLLILFSKLRITGFGKGVVKFFAPAAFGVYLIHVQPTVFSAMKGRFIPFAQSPVWLMVLQVLGMSLAILAACLLVEKLRLVLFRLLKIDWLCDRFAEWADKTIRRLPMIRKLYE